MDRVEEIEAAIEELAPEDFRRIIEWVREREQDQWEAQMDRDSSSGRLESLFDEAEKETANGSVLPWPPTA